MQECMLAFAPHENMASNQTTDSGRSRWHLCDDAPALIIVDVYPSWGGGMEVEFACVNGSDEARETFATGDSFGLRFSLVRVRPVNELHLIFFVHKPDGTLVCQDVLTHRWEEHNSEGPVNVRFEVPSLPLGPGRSS